MQADRNEVVGLGNVIKIYFLCCRRTGSEAERSGGLQATGGGDIGKRERGERGRGNGQGGESRSGQKAR